MWLAVKEFRNLLWIFKSKQNYTFIQNEIHGDLNDLDEFQNKQRRERERRQQQNQANMQVLSKTQKSRER